MLLLYATAFIRLHDDSPDVLDHVLHESFGSVSAFLDLFQIGFPLAGQFRRFQTLVVHEGYQVAAIAGADEILLLTHDVVAV